MAALAANGVKLCRTFFSHIPCEIPLHAEQAVSLKEQAALRHFKSQISNGKVKSEI